MIPELMHFITTVFSLLLILREFPVCLHAAAYTNSAVATVLYLYLYLLLHFSPQTNPPRDPCLARHFSQHLKRHSVFDLLT